MLFYGLSCALALLTLTSLMGLFEMYATPVLIFLAMFLYFSKLGEILGWLRAVPPVLDPAESLFT